MAAMDMARRNYPMPALGTVVHVAAPGRPCEAGIVLDEGRTARVRVLRPAATGVVGARDHEGDYRHKSDPQTVPGGMTHDGRAYLLHDLPTWHELYECERGRRSRG